MSSVSAPLRAPWRTSRRLRLRPARRRPRPSHRPAMGKAWADGVLLDHPRHLRPVWWSRAAGPDERPVRRHDRRARHSRHPEPHRRYEAGQVDTLFWLAVLVLLVIVLLSREDAP